MANRVTRRLLLSGGIGVTAAGAGTLWLAADRASNASPSPIPSQPTPSRSGSPSPSVAPVPSKNVSVLAGLDPAKIVKVTQSGWVGWALMDRSTGEIIGSKTIKETNFSCSMIKCWIVSDYLRRQAEAGKTPSKTRMDQLSKILRDSHNEYAQMVWNESGRNECAKRMAKICGFTNYKIDSSGWSRFGFSAIDTVRLANAIGSGKAAGPKWTAWVISEMRQVRSPGNFGVIQAFGATERKSIAIKNGWVDREEGFYNTNHLAFTDKWAMSVLTRYPLKTSASNSYGAAIGKSVAAQLRANTELV